MAMGAPASSVFRHLGLLIKSQCHICWWEAIKVTVSIFDSPPPPRLVLGCVEHEADTVEALRRFMPEAFFAVSDEPEESEEKGGGGWFAGSFGRGGWGLDSTQWVYLQLSQRTSPLPLQKCSLRLGPRPNPRIVSRHQMTISIACAVSTSEESSHTPLRMYLFIALAPPAVHGQYSLITLSVRGRCLGCGK